MESANGSTQALNFKYGYLPNCVLCVSIITRIVTIPFHVATTHTKGKLYLSMGFGYF